MAYDKDIIQEVLYVLYLQCRSTLRRTVDDQPCLFIPNQAYSAPVLAYAQFQLFMLPLFLIANMCIGYGIRYGYKATDQLGYTLIFSKCLEILISLGVAYLFLKEVPTWKNWAGIGIIALGIFLVKQK